MKRLVIHILAAAILIAASMAIWNWRFVVDPGALPETRLATPLVGWESRPTQRYEIVHKDNETRLVLERSGVDDNYSGIQVWFDKIEHVRYVHIRCEYRYQDVEPGNESYKNARFVSLIKDASGKTSHPEGGFQVFGTIGSSPWRKTEVVQKLTTEMHRFGLSMAMLGDSGRLEVRKLSVSAVRQRPWVPFATIFLVAGWIAFCGSLIRIRSSSPSAGRAFAGALVIVAAAWVLVFPQTKNFLRPLPGGFEVGEVSSSSPPADRPVTSPEAPAPRKAEHPPASTAEKPPPQRPKAPPAEKPVDARDSGRLFHLLYEVDQRFAAAHLVLFTGLTLLVLLVTGETSQWCLPLAIAFLAELIPELTDHLGGLDDWADLLSNVAGVGLAVLLWLRLPFLKRFHIRSAE